MTYRSRRVHSCRYIIGGWVVAIDMGFADRKAIADVVNLHEFRLSTIVPIISITNQRRMNMHSALH